MAAFGVIAAGRMVQTDFTMLKEGEYIIELPNANSINHIVVFLTGLQPLPADFGASIFVSWPTPNAGLASANWHNLGYISNEKPSAIFRIGRLNKSARDQPVFNDIEMIKPSIDGAESAVLGIMLEPMVQIRSKGESAEGAMAMPTTEQGTVADFAQKVLRNFVNYVQSFAVSLPKHDRPMGSTEMTEYVPAKAVTDWFQNFQRRLQMNPNFWKTLP